MQALFGDVAGFDREISSRDDRHDVGHQVVVVERAELVGQEGAGLAVHRADEPGAFLVAAQPRVDIRNEKFGSACPAALIIIVTNANVLAQLVVECLGRREHLGAGLGRDVRNHFVVDAAQ